MLKKVINIVSFITGGLLNIGVVLLTLFLVYMGITRGFENGKLFFTDQDNTKRASEDIIIHIPEDADAKDIGLILKAHDLTSNEWAFYLQARLNGTYNLFRPGDHLLNANMTVNEIMEILQKSQYSLPEDELKITIVEGLTNKQIAEFLASKGYFTAKEFLDECADGEYDYPFLQNVPEGRDEKRLEGYLFPDTYNLPPNPTPRDVISRMLKRFDDVMTDELRLKAENLNMTIDEVVIMASIIEKEIKVPGERPLCSAVIHNRLEAGQKLEMCSTILYVLDKRKDRLFDSDLQVVSPYNTYINAGLPVGPISNPGAAALTAAVNPANESYLYFVVRDEETGEHFFTASYDDFLTAKALYNQKY